jgi:hypothetical protein
MSLSLDSISLCESQLMGQETLEFGEQCGVLYPSVRCPLRLLRFPSVCFHCFLLFQHHVRRSSSLVEATLSGHNSNQKQTKSLDEIRNWYSCWCEQVEFSLRQPDSLDARQQQIVLSGM